MLPLSVLALAPLLGGYIFASNWHRTRIQALRSEGHRLIFLAAIWGVIFLVFATIAVSILVTIDFFQQIGELWLEVVPIQNSGRSMIAFSMGAILWRPLNRLGRRFPSSFLGKQAAADREILNRQNPFDMLMREALGTRRLVSVTVSNGKVYIGRVRTAPNPAFDTESIDLVVSRSGHRDPETQNMTIDIDYDKTLEEMRNDLRDQFIAELSDVYAQNPEADDDVLLGMARRRASRARGIRAFEIVIPIEQVRSVNFFEEEIYRRVIGANS